MKVLVTGGAGFIGSHLCEHLFAGGYDVVVLDNLSFGCREWVPAGARLIEGDITNLETCKAAAEEVQGIFHCAAMSRSGPSNDVIEVCTASNVVGTQNVLMAARHHRCPARGLQRLLDLLRQPPCAPPRGRSTAFS